MMDSRLTRLAGWLFAVLLAMLPVTGAERKPLPPGPRGQPIRPPAAQRPPASTNLATVITLPGGVVITNIPGEFLPQDVKIVRLPAAAARKFARYGYQPVSFTELARFFLKVPQPGPGLSQSDRWKKVREQIPSDVAAMHGRKIAITGFTLPVTLVDGRATEFLLLRTQAACCFGMVPRINELLIVKMDPPGMRPELDVPVVVGGVLDIKWIGEGEQLTAIYELQADRVDQASD
jgi:hypothetical protein